jgi:hypothetical protein
MSPLDEEFKSHLVDWKLELGLFPSYDVEDWVRKLSMFNQALLGKWLLCYSEEGDHFLRNVIGAKYGEAWG